jgi:hypothetical protein
MNPFLSKSEAPPGGKRAPQIAARKSSSSQIKECLLRSAAIDLAPMIGCFRRVKAAVFRGYVTMSASRLKAHCPAVRRTQEWQLKPAVFVRGGMSAPRNRGLGPTLPLHHGVT